MLLVANIPHTGREIQKQGSKSDDEWIWTYGVFTNQLKSHHIIWAMN